MVINEYCSINLCAIVPSNGDLPARYVKSCMELDILVISQFLMIYSVSSLSVSEQDVAIPNSLLSRNTQGQLVVGFYIQTQQGFIALATIQQSVMVGKCYWHFT